MLGPKIEPTKRPALYSIANRATEPTAENFINKVSRPMTRAVVAKAEKHETRPKAVKLTASAKPLPLSRRTAAAETVSVKTEKEIDGLAPMDISEVDALADEFSHQMLDVEDMDAADEGNPQLASIYASNIYEYMRQLEVTFAIRPKYLEGQIITGHMRGILIDWLSQVARRFEMLPETFYLTVKILDRYLQECTVAKNKLQLVGITSLLVAAKYEEIYVPSIVELAYLTDRAYTDIEIRRMEVIILKQLDFSFGCPLPLHFLRRASKAGRVDVTVHTLAKYFTELAIAEYDLVHHKPSLIAASALYLSLMLLRQPANWSNTLVYYSKYTEKEVKPVSCKMAAVVLKVEKSKLQAIKNRFASSQLLGISTIQELKGDTIKALAAMAT